MSMFALNLKNNISKVRTFEYAYENNLVTVLALGAKWQFPTTVLQSTIKSTKIVFVPFPPIEIPVLSNN